MINQNSLAQIKDELSRYDTAVENVILSLSLPDVQVEGYKLSEEDTIQLTQLLQNAKSSSDFILAQLSDIIAGCNGDNHIPKVIVPNLDSIMDNILENEGF